MRRIVGVAMGIPDSAIVILEIEPRRVGTRDVFHNGAHLEVREHVTDHLAARHVERVRADALAAALSKLLRTTELSNEDEVQIYVDRTVVGEPSVADLRKKIDRHFSAFEVKDEAAPPVGVHIVSGPGMTHVAKPVAPARDVVAALVVALNDSRLKIAGKRANGLEGELNGFDGQPDRVRARALAIAVWAADRTPTAYVDGSASITKEERRMMDAAAHGLDEDDAVDFADDDPRLDDDEGPELGRGGVDVGGFGMFWGPSFWGSER